MSNNIIDMGIQKKRPEGWDPDRPVEEVNISVQYQLPAWLHRIIGVFKRK